MEPTPEGELAIRTARLELRRPGPADVPAVLGLLGDPRTTVHNPGDAVADETRARQLVDRWTRHWSDHGIGYFVVTWRDDPDVLGVCGVKEMTLHGRAVWNLLYRLHSEMWAQGIATEAATAVVQRAAAWRPRRPVVARVRPANQASARVAEGRADQSTRAGHRRRGRPGPPLLVSPSGSSVTVSGERRSGRSVPARWCHLGRTSKESGCAGHY